MVTFIYLFPKFSRLSKYCGMYKIFYCLQNYKYLIVRNNLVLLPSYKTLMVIIVNLWMFDMIY